RARAAHGQRGEQHRIAAGEDAKGVQVARRAANQLEVLEVSARILDALDRALARQRGHRGRLGHDLRELRDVVEEDRDGAVRGEVAVEGEYRGLVDRVVKGRGDQRRIRAQARGRVDLRLRRCQMALGDSADDGNPAARGLKDRAEHSPPGRLVEGRRLAGGAQGHQAGHAAGQHMLDEAVDRGLVDASVFGQRGDQRRQHSSQRGDIEHALRLTVMAWSTVAEVLELGAAGDPAIVVPDGPTFTYAGLRDLCAEAQLALGASGVKPGDRVAMVYPNSAEAIVLFLAASSIAVACPLNPAYKEDEFRFFLEDTGARFLVVPPGQAPEARAALPAGAGVIEAKIDGARLRVSHSG